MDEGKEMGLCLRGREVRVRGVCVCMCVFVLVCMNTCIYKCKYLCMRACVCMPV